MKILHIHQDYPDGWPGSKTLAVKNLLDATRDQHDHFVLSINRTSNPLKASFRRFDEGLRVVYWALPLPLVYAPAIALFARLALGRLKGQAFDVVHAHKITTEGVWGWEIARRLQRPLVLSLRGGSDLRNVRRLKLNALYRRIVASARHVFLVSPWARPEIERAIGQTFAQSSNLPNICKFTTVTSLPERHPGQYCCIADLNTYARKGLPQLIEALSLLKREGRATKIDIFGGGSANKVQALEALIAAHDVGDLVVLKGRLDNAQLLERIASYQGFILPSINETFGMAYVEALSAGLPVLYHAKTGVDGLIPEEVGLKIQDRSPARLAEAIAMFDRDNALYLQAVRTYQESGRILAFLAAPVAEHYNAVLSAPILGATSQPDTISTV